MPGVFRHIAATFKQIKRVVVITAGFTVLVIGIALLVLPGPAFIVIPLGLGILATELLWARKLMDRLKSVFRKMKEKAERAKKNPSRKF